MKCHLFILLLGVTVVRAQPLRTPKNWGIRNLHQHWLLTDKHETLVVQHNISDNVSVGLTTHFWVEAGRGPTGRYLCDTMIIRYYVDGESRASLAFTPSMAAGSGVGLESQAYYAADQRVFPRGSRP